eukprot:gene10345-biopygen10817
MSRHRRFGLTSMKKNLSPRDRHLEQALRDVLIDIPHPGLALTRGQGRTYCAICGKGEWYSCGLALASDCYLNVPARLESNTPRCIADVCQAAAWNGQVPGWKGNRCPWGAPNTVPSCAFAGEMHLGRWLHAETREDNTPDKIAVPYGGGASRAQPVGRQARAAEPDGRVAVGQDSSVQTCWSKCTDPLAETVQKVYRASVQWTVGSGSRAVQ